MKLNETETFTRTIEYDDKSRQLTSTIWRNSEGKISNPDGPAVTEYDDEGRIKEQKWMFNNYLDRNDDKPALVQYDWDTCIRREEFYHMGRLHRNNGPAIINYDIKTNKVLFQNFFRRGNSFEP